MKVIALSLVQHKGEERIALMFAYDGRINLVLKKNPHIFWSKTIQRWHMPCTREAIRELKASLEGIATIETTTIREQLQFRSLLTKEDQHPPLRAITPVKKAPPRLPAEPARGQHYISENNLQALEEFKKHLELKAYSKSTLKTYRCEFTMYLQTLQDKRVQDLTSDEIKGYLIWCMKEKGLTEHTVHSRMNAIKFYFEKVLRQETLFLDIPRPKKPRILPKVISEEKIIRGLLAIPNLKHKALLLLAYSAGLRVSEVISLQLNDIDPDRMQIYVNRAKGKKDRVVGLSASILKILREYYKVYRPQLWLFEGENPERHYSVRSAQKIFKSAYKDLGLPSQCSFHSLRHSFATHLLESGTDITYIQKLLGHNDIKTTMRYASVSNKDMSQIESPLDRILRKKGKN